MKILNSISAVYEEIYPAAVKLREEVSKIVNSFKSDSWYYFARIKTKESFAQKLETGRVENIREPDDFFACTLVVKNKNEILEAEKRINTHFFVKKRKPEDDTFTHKEAYSFEFDDLRLYVNIRPPEYLPPSPINDFIFEIQIKTFLEHAWAITTHDLIYKSDDISWPKARVAYQVKAMLELAEASVNRVESLSQSPELLKRDRKNNILNLVRDFLVTSFPPESLPKDLFRLSQNILNIFGYFNLKIEDIKKMLDKETLEGRGVKTLDLSPYSIILQTIIFQSPAHFNSAFRLGNKIRSKRIFVPKEIDLSGLQIEDEAKIIRS